MPLGRRFRSLKLFFVLRMFGASALRAYIRNHCHLAAYFAHKVAADDRFALTHAVSLSLVCFRLRASDAANLRLLDAANATGRVFLVHTKAEDKIVLRCAVGNPNTKAEHLDEAWAVLARCADAVLAEEEGAQAPGVEPAA